MLTLRNVKLLVSSATMLLFLTNCGPVNFTNDENKSEAAKDTTSGLTTEIPDTQPEPNLQTNDPLIDSHLDEIGEAIERIDPHTRRRNIFSVQTSVLVGIKSVEVDVQRRLHENPDLCKIHVDTQALMVTVDVERPIPMIRCDGFIKARAIRASNAGSCTPRVANGAPSVSVQVGNVVDVNFNYELTQDCICQKRFHLNVISMRGKGVKTEVEVKAFVNPEKCATLFPEYASSN